jgi:hypothetical protein
MPIRISDTVRLGPFRIRLSAPVTGRGRVRVSAGTRTPLGWLSVSGTRGKRGQRRG